jgi:sugar lactone lactonase YvrE
VSQPLAQLPVPRAALGEGPCWDPAEGALYWTDIPAHQVHRLAADCSHSAWDTGQPVGAIVPRAGGGLALAAKDGFPAAHVTSCAFGGTDLATLYITTAAGPGACGGALFSGRPGATGLSANPFRG